MKFLKIFRPNYSQKQYAADKDNEYLYDGFGHFNYSYEGHVLSNIDRIEKQKEHEREFAAIIQIWLRKLIFKNQKEQIETNYEDLSTFHYPHTKHAYKFLEFIALEKGSIHQTQVHSTFKEMLIIILLIHDFFRRCLEFQTKIFIKFNSKNKTFLLHHEIECESEEM